MVSVKNEEVETDRKEPLEGSKKRENWAARLFHEDVSFSVTVAPFANETPPPVGAGDRDGCADRETELRSVLLPKKDPDAVELPTALEKELALEEELAELISEWLVRAEGVGVAESQPLAVPAAVAVGKGEPVDVVEPPKLRRSISCELWMRK